ncbi:MAG: Clp1/GlmU family protein [Armatimonadota bacterium]
MIPVPSEWRDIIAQAARELSLVMLIGGTDTGKTTMCSLMASEAVAAGRKVAVVDGDIGQSEIGPPGCISLGIPTTAPVRLHDLRPRALYFVGSTSPPGFLVECVSGTVRMAARAKELGADLVIVDTTGLIRGYSGRKLKTAKFDCLQPDLAIVIQRTDEAEPLISALPPSRVCRAPVPADVRLKTPDTRGLRRRARLAAYFRESKEIELSLPQLIRRGTHLLTGCAFTASELESLGKGLSSPLVRGERGREGCYVVASGHVSEADLRLLSERLAPEPVRVVNLWRFVGTAVGLMDGDANALAMGLVKHMDLATLRATVVTPWFDTQSIRGIWFGVMRAYPDGTELEPLRRGEI